jgi:hypothetical protein
MFNLSSAMRNRLSWVVGLLAGLLIVAGCGTPRETVEVAERPPAPVDTVTSPVDTLSVAEDRSVEVPIPAAYDTVQVGQFDRGKLWPLNQVPADHFRSAHGVDPDSQWIAKAKAAALRFGEGCSASFVSARGLVMTNHHCARDAITKVGKTGESLLEDGFYADSLDDERTVPDLHVDRLVKIEDVTKRVNSREGRGTLQQRIEGLEQAMTEKAQRKGENHRVEIVKLYHGARYSAYTYRRYEDVRLVMAPELQVGYFGGETDNFTYPRFSLDVAFFRVYAEDDTPLRPEHHFSWDVKGAEVGESVFVVGNPGSTSRLEMISQWEYTRDYELPARLEVFRHRRNLLKSYIANNPEKASTYDLRNSFFSVGNTIKSIQGQLNGLEDPYLMARRAKAVRSLRDTIASVDSLQQYNRVVAQIKQLQQSKRILADKHRAFLTFANVKVGSRILARAVHAYYYDFLRTRGASPDRVEDIRADAEKIEDWPAELEKSFLTAHLEEIRDAFGANHPTLQKLLRKQSPEELATELVENSALTDSTAFVKLLDDGYLKSEDPSVPVIEALAPLFLNTTRQMQDIQRSEANMHRRLSKARLALYGTRIPPDATFTLRLSDGVVKGYSYNGTVAPAFTNFYGLYDRYYSHDGDDWALPDRWITPPDSFDLDTPLNIVSTNDISGGSSGSPLLNKDLEIVGVIFDSNMQALPNEYLYREREARAISVDVRGIVEALDDMYGATRLVQELTGGKQERATAQAPSSAGE